ncbi:MAG: YraN family protein [Victivallales bacterium]|nr:YraN family protein [Victivallales bacterium]
MFSLDKLFRRCLPSVQVRLRRKAQRLGRRGEDAAVFFLEYAGYDILYRNWRPPHGHGEIDIIARSPDGVLCFVEVKSRRLRPGFPEPRPLDAVDREKQRQICRSAAAYLRSVGRLVFKLRFDVIEVWAKGAFPCRVRHWSGAFGKSTRIRGEEPGRNSELYLLP